MFLFCAVRLQIEGIPEKKAWKLSVRRQRPDSWGGVRK
jgi:hypothetical protein